MWVSIFFLRHCGLLHSTWREGEFYRPVSHRAIYGEINERRTLSPIGYPPGCDGKANDKSRKDLHYRRVKSNRSFLFRARRKLDDARKQEHGVPPRAFSRRKREASMTSPKTYVNPADFRADGGTRRISFPAAQTDARMPGALHRVCFRISQVRVWTSFREFLIGPPYISN